MNKLVVFRPGAEGRCNIREDSPGAGDEEAAPMRLAPEITRSPTFPPSVDVKRFFNNLQGTQLQLVHILRAGPGAVLRCVLVGMAKVDMSFFTSPWQSGQCTSASRLITSRSKV
jgi:hypothetical protein